MSMKKIVLIAAFAAVPAMLAAQTQLAKDPKRTGFTAQAIEAEAISGLASSGRNCIGPSGANTHSIGWVPANSHVTITFSSDFDPVAAATIAQMGSGAPDRIARVGYWSDDDGGGNLEPRLAFTTGYEGTLVLFVSKFSAERTAGCYFYKVEIVTG